MQTVSTDQLVGQTLGNYVVKGLLGRGRLSAVYLAQHPAQKQTVALTTFLIPERFTSDMRNRFVQRFMREAAALTSLTHRNLLPMHEYGEQFGYPYLITPYMTNGSLADVLAQKGRCTPTYVLEVLEQVAAGLDYAHRKGVVHGTLKPANILLGTDQNLLVAGFGLVHMLQMRGIEQNDQPYSYLLSIADTFLYASNYIAPEVVQGQPIDSRSDIYALGIMLFELLNGKPPFTGSSPLDTAMQHVQQPLPSLHKLRPDVPIALELVINHALARDPGQRFQRVSELAEAFSQVCKGSASRPVYNASKNEPVKIAPATHSAKEAPEEEIAMGGWLTAPATKKSKSSSFLTEDENIASLQSQQVSTSNTDAWQILPPIVTGHVATVRPSQQLPSAKPPLERSTNRSPMQPMRAPQNMPVASSRNVAPPEPPKRDAVAPVSPVNAESFLQEDDATKTPTWWVQAPSQLDMALSRNASEGPLRLPGPDLAMSMEQSDKMPVSDRIMRIRPVPKRSRGMGRRRAIATIAAGGVVAAGALVVGKLNLLHLAGGTQAPVVQQGGTITQQAPPQQTGNGGNQPTGGKGQNKNVVGNTALAKNSSMTFTNPGNGKSSALIHLPNGNFVAFDRACTHVGVLVNYDPNTHTMICPAHGAVFDPAKNAAVLQGPATLPLKPVAIHINADGTISAM